MNWKQLPVIGLIAKVLSSRKFGQIYCPHFLYEFRQLGETNFLARFNGDIELQIKIRDWGIPLFNAQDKAQAFTGLGLPDSIGK